jgi:hypothetical protein
VLVEKFYEKGDDGSSRLWADAFYFSTFCGGISLGGCVFMCVVCCCSFWFAGLKMLVADDVSEFE